MAQPIIFVRGTGRCGSKTLANLLGEHPALARVPNQCLPEELIDWCEYHLRARAGGATGEAVAAGCRAFFEAYGRCVATRPGILLQKSTANVHRLAALLEYWPEAKIIYIVRHPLGVVPAFVACDLFEFKGMYRYDATVTSSLLRWYNDVQAYIRSPVFGHRRVLHVHFEDMLDDPDRFFERVYRFIGIDDTIRHTLRGRETYDDQFVLSRREREWIIDSTADVVARLGYDPAAWSPAVPVELADRVDAYPDRRLAAPPPALDGVELVRLALAEAKALGYEKVGLFGAGYLSHLICPHLGHMPAQIVALFDEHPMLVGGQLAGIPIHRPSQARELGVQVVIPVTMVHQATLIERWNRVTGGDPPVVPLWARELSATLTAPPCHTPAL